MKADGYELSDADRAELEELFPEFLAVVGHMHDAGSRCSPAPTSPPTARLGSPSTASSSC
jgi:hypothetical protein